MAHSTANGEERPFAKTRHAHQMSFGTGHADQQTSDRSGAGMLFSFVNAVSTKPNRFHPSTPHSNNCPSFSLRALVLGLARASDILRI